MINKNFLKKIKEGTKNIGIDFDGVIHKNSKGFHDGTIYDEPVLGTEQSLKKLSKKYNLIIYTCKADSERPLINGKTGTELLWDWLEKYNLKQYIQDITDKKPHVLYYIDDKGIEFKNWKDTLVKIKM